MNNPFDFFDEIYCINLDNRTDKWETVKKEFEKLGILDRVKRFSAVKHVDGRIGLVKSNLGIFKLAQEANLNNVLILEDDVEFLNNPIENLTKAIEQLKTLEWQMFYLGANTHNKLNKVTDNLVLLKNAFATHAVCYNKNMFQKMIVYSSTLTKIISNFQILDVWLSTTIQTNNKTYMVNPLIATQSNTFSDIEKRQVNQSYIVERFNKNIK